jgi:hypothetical protein
MGKLSALTSNNTPVTADLFVMIQAAGPTDVKVTLANLLTAMFVTPIATSTNAGTAGGTINYLNLGGLKILWGRTGSLSVAGAQQATATLIFPVTFTTAPTVIPALTAEAVETKLRAGNNAVPTTTGVILEIVTTTGTNAPGGTAAQIDWFAIGV